MTNSFLEDNHMFIFRDKKGYITCGAIHKTNPYHLTPVYADMHVFLYVVCVTVLNLIFPHLTLMLSVHQIKAYFAKFSNPYMQTALTSTTLLFGMPE